MDPIGGAGFNPDLWAADEAQWEEQLGTPTAPANDDAIIGLVERLRAKLLTRDQLRNIPPARYLIKDVLDLDSESWLIGASGGFKSFVAIDWACHVATGQHWWGRKVRQGKVFYIVAEGAKSFGKRVDAWEVTHSATADNLTVLPMPVQARGVSLRDSISPNWQALCALATEIQPALVVLDTQARMTVGLEENNNTAMGVWIEAVRLLRAATGACVLVVHHTGRSGENARGASALDGAQDAEWKVTRIGERGDRRAELFSDKVKDGDDNQRLNFQAHVVELGFDDEGDPITSLTRRQTEVVGRAPTSTTWFVESHLASLADGLGLPADTSVRKTRDAVMLAYQSERHAGKIWEAVARIRRNRPASTVPHGEKSVSETVSNTGVSGWPETEAA